MQDVNPIIMMYDGLYVDGELWELWKLSHDRPSMADFWRFMESTYDEGSEFTRLFAFRVV